jgi:hypothetical protein
MEIEKQRGISVASSVMQFDYDGHTINLLDTLAHSQGLKRRRQPTPWGQRSPTLDRPAAPWTRPLGANRRRGPMPRDHHSTFRPWS